MKCIPYELGKLELGNPPFLLRVARYCNINAENLKLNENSNNKKNSSITFQLNDITTTKSNLKEERSSFVEKFSFRNKPSGYWDNQENILQFLNELKEKLNLNTSEDWNTLSTQKLYLYGGRALLKKYSLYQIKCLGFPEGKLSFNKIIQYKPVGYWNNQDNIQQFLHELKEKLNLNSSEDWNKLSQKDIKNNGGGALLHKYSMYELKTMGYPKGRLSFDKPANYWVEKQNVVQFLHDFKEKYKLNTIDDWNSVTYHQIQSFGGRTLLKNYSLFELKCIGFPEGISKFDSAYKPVGYWEKQENIQQFLANLKEKLNIKSKKDWNRVSKDQIQANGGTTLTTKFSMKEIIQMQTGTFVKSNKKSAQRWLFLQIQKLLPNEEIIEDYFHSEISREAGSSVQFDIFLVHKNIAIEYHGKHHYEDIPSGFASIEMYKFRDKEKENLCKKYNIQLIIIPYWWDNNIDSLKATLISQNVVLK